MAKKTANKTFLYLGVLLIATAVISFFLFGDDMQFQLLNDLVGKPVRFIIVGLLGLGFVFLWMKEKKEHEKTAD